MITFINEKPSILQTIFKYTHNIYCRHVYRHRPGMCTVGVQGMFHHYGNCGVMSTCLYSGVKLVVMKNYDLEKYIHLIQKHKVGLYLFLFTKILIMAVRIKRTHTQHTSIKSNGF